MAGIQKTYPITPPRADLVKQDFDTVVYQKGRSVLFEKALICPCKGEDTNQQSNCKNCGGSGWIFVNPKETRMVITGVGIVNNLRQWSEETVGDINITCNESEQLSYMDRITLLEGEAIFNQVLFFKERNDIYFAFAAYNIKKVLYAGMFMGIDSKLTVIDSNRLTFDKNIVKLDVSGLSLPPDGLIGITIRYIHAPSYHVIEMKRETMQTYRYSTGTEILQNMPLSGIGRRAQYILTAPNLQGDNLLDNSYPEDGTCEIDCGC